MDKITVSNNIISVETIIPQQVIPERIETKEYNVDDLLRELNRLNQNKSRLEEEIDKTCSEIKNIEDMLSRCEIKIPDCPMDDTEQIEK